MNRKVAVCLSTDRHSAGRSVRTGFGAGGSTGTGSSRKSNEASTFMARLVFSPRNDSHYPRLGATRSITYRVVKITDLLNGSATSQPETTGKIRPRKTACHRWFSRWLRGDFRAGKVC